MIAGDTVLPQKVIGLIGGMSWESSAEYYRIINERIRDRLGGLHSARCLMWSFDFAQVEALQRAGRWDAATVLMIEAAQRLERGGADFVLICTNTMHRMAAEVQAAIALPLLHIADPTAERIQAAGLRRVGLLGTAFTMEQDFYKGRLTGRHGLEVLVPDDEGRAMVHRVIYDELVQGRAEPASRQVYRKVITGLWSEVRRQLSWAAPRSCCWSAPKTAPCRSSIPRPSMPRLRWRWRSNDRCG